MITKIYKRVKNKKGVKFCRNAHGKGGASSCTLKIGGAPANRVEVEARAGKNSFPPTPFLFARPSEFFSEISVGIFLEKSSDFVQKSQPLYAAAGFGFEPKFLGPRPKVLPLDDPAMLTNTFYPTSNFPI